MTKEEKKEYDKKYNRENKERRREYRNSHKEEIKEQKKEYYQEHKEEKKEYNKKRYQIHKKEICERSSQWKKDNPDKVKLSNKKWRENNLDKIKELIKRWQKANPEKVRAATKKWRDKNPKKVNLMKRTWEKKHPEKLRESRKKADAKRLSVPQGRLDNNISNAIGSSLKGKKAGRKWETLVGYTLENLIEHLENLFDDKMNWDNYGKYERGKFKWHIDHIKPKSLFHYEIAEDPEFKKCWALKNLQPLEAVANIRKKNHYEDLTLI